MATRSRLRRWRTGAAASIVAAAICAPVAMAATAFYHREEGVQKLQVDATLHGDRLAVVETIDYRFGLDGGRGIWREIDLGILDQDGAVQLQNPAAATATAAGDLQVFDHSTHTELLVGRPSVTHRGVHRYQLAYELVGVPDPAVSGRFVYIAVGYRWDVPLHDVTVRIATDFEPGDVTCEYGREASLKHCSTTVEDGIITAHLPRLGPRQGLVLAVDRGPDRDPAHLAAPPLSLDQAGMWWLQDALRVGAAAAIAAAFGAIMAGQWLRRVGSDRTASFHDPSEAAYASGEQEGIRISSSEAERQVTIQFAPPGGLTPAQGAVVSRNEVDDAARTAWLAQAMIDGWIDITGQGRSTRIVRGPRAGQPDEQMPQALKTAFSGRQEVRLGRYDPAFAAGWKDIGNSLQSWQQTCGLWDTNLSRTKDRQATLFLGVAIVAGGALALGLATLWGGNLVLAIPAAALAGLLFGTGWRARKGTATLSVRSPEGFGTWLRIEGFRRFLAGSEGEHARWAADQGLLREYSAWAVALGELSRWDEAAAASGVPPTDQARTTTTRMHHLNAASRRTAAVPLSERTRNRRNRRPSSTTSPGGRHSGGVGGGGGGSW